jgi:hypothetical protein
MSEEETLNTEEEKVETDQLDEASIILLMLILFLGLGTLFVPTFPNFVIILSAVKMAIDGYRNDGWGVKISAAAIGLAIFFLIYQNVYAL